MSWIAFWNGAPSIYVNERHKQAHYQRLASDFSACISAHQAVVLDHGCGEARAADRVAANCARLYLLDAAPIVRDGLRARFANAPAIAVIDDLAPIADASLDLVIAHSLAQYLSQAELEALLRAWRAKLKPGGALLLGDVLDPARGALDEVGALLRFALAEGFFAPACLGLVRTALSDYPRLRRQLGLARYREDQALALLMEAGFAPMRRRPNPGHDQGRMAFLAVKPPAP